MENVLALSACPWKMGPFIECSPRIQCLQLEDLVVHTFPAQVHIQALVMAMRWWQEQDYQTKIWSLYSSILPEYMALAFLSLRELEVKEDIS